MPAGCYSGGVGRSGAPGSHASWYWDGGTWQYANLIRWPWGGCFSFSGDGSVVLDDENVPCLEPFSEIESISSVCDEGRRLSKEMESVSPVSGADVSCCRDNCFIIEGKDLNEAIKKQSNKNYSSFDPSPPVEKFSEFVTSDLRENSIDLCDESKPLLVGASPCASDEVTGGKTNDLNSSVKKEICYDKIIPLPVTLKDLNKLKDHGTDNFGYDVGNNHIKSEEFSDKTRSPVATPTTKETIVLCNDLDSVCQVIPLSFSPNLYPDVGSVPLINCQASRKSALPSPMFSTVVSTADDNSDSYVTVLSRTGNRVRSAASWPRRRPQSLRVAICYSTPECRQEVGKPVRCSVDSQEIGMRDMSHGKEALHPSSSTTSFLKAWGSLENLETNKSSKSICGFESSFSQSQPDCSKLDDFFQADSESRLDMLNYVQVKEKCYESDIQEVLTDVSGDSQKIAAAAASLPLVQSSQINTRPSNLPQLEMVSPVYASYLMSPSSDKENDPALLSVRPKVKQSPRRKKNSPKKKSKSPKKNKLGNTREEQNKLQKACSSDYGSEVSVHSVKCGNLDDDVWAVDDFLPLPKNKIGNTLPFGLQDFEVCNSHNFKSTSLQPLMPPSDVQKHSPIHSTSAKDFENSMVTSTFSTDTGYETETNRSEKDTNIAEKAKILIKQPVDGSDTECKLKDQNHPLNASNYSLAASSELASEATTPHTVAEDFTEYYSITSELSNAPYSTRQGAGEDTPDYLSICSEMPGVPRLPEDSPMVDFEMNPLFPEVSKYNNLLPSPLDSPESGEPSTMTDSPITVAKSVVEDVEEKNSPEHGPSDGSHSATPSVADSSPNTPDKVPSQELVEIKYVQLSLSIVLAIVLHAMQSISQFMLEIFLATEHEGYWD